MKDINDFVYSMQHGKEKFVLTDEGDIDKFLGIEITHRENGEFEMSQPFLIDQILKFLQLEDNGWETSTKGSTTPAAAQILNKDLSGMPRKKSWGYPPLLVCCHISSVTRVQTSPWQYIRLPDSVSIQC